MKKMIILSFFLSLGFATHVLAQGFVPLASIPGLTDSTSAVVNSDSLASFFNNLYKYLIGLAAILAVIEIIWGGLEYSTQDSVSKKSDGKERIIQAIFGLVLVLSPVLVFSIINPSILNLSLNLPPIRTQTPNLSPADSTTVIINTAIRTATAAGCSVTGTDPTALTTTVTTIQCPNTIPGLNAATAFTRTCPSSSGRVSGIGPYQATCDMTPSRAQDMVTPNIDNGNIAP